jgi:hypothetical protein
MVGVGMRFNFSDPISSHTLDVSASYTPTGSIPDKERVHLGVGYRFWNWRASLAFNRADFYDLFGPTKMSRKGLLLNLDYHDYLLADEPEMLSYGARVGGYWRLERLPEYQSVGVAYDRFFSLLLRMNYSFLEQSLGAVEEERGMTVNVIAPTNLILGVVFPRLFVDASWGFLLPINHSSIWIRPSAGKAFGPRFESLANFYFGGFGNNWVDHGPVAQYRDPFGFPGIDVNRQAVIGGTNYAKLVLEWDLPPLRFQRFGFDDFYVTWARCALFTSGIMSNIDDPASRTKYINIGSQLDVRLVLFSSLPSTFSLGYALASPTGRLWSREFMISLKIL